VVATSPSFSWELFFEPEPLLMNEGCGFSHFGPEHIVAMLVCAAFIALVAWRFSRMPADLGWKGPRRRALLVLAVVPLALLGSRDAIMAARGCFSGGFLPLHACNIAEGADLVFAIWPSVWAGDIVFCLGIVGGIAAILLCGWTYCPIWSYVSLGGFAEHSMLVAFALCMLMSGTYVPDRRRLAWPCAFTLCMAAGAHAVNGVFGSNYCFVSRPLPGTPLEFFANLLGNPGYLVPYAVGVMAAWWGLYAAYDAISVRIRAAAPQGGQAAEAPGRAANAR
jgi:hypothetical integral membrane protein (TIGR02206 family)